MIKPLRIGLYSWMTATSNFKTSITTGGVTRLYYNFAPESAVIPFCVFDLLPINEEKDSGNKIYRFLFQVRVVSNTLDNRDIVQGYLHDLLDAGDPTFTGYSTRYVGREPTIDLGKIDNYYNSITQYRLIIQKS